MLPETILQFGTGRLLRGLPDLIVHHANAAGRPVGRVVAVQSTGGDRAGGLTRQGGKFAVAVRGYEGGRVVDRVEECESVSRALPAATRWADVRDAARSDAGRLIVSNTTESGFAVDPADGPSDAPPRSFPAKLLAVLRARFDAGGSPSTVVPCELIDGNASKLKGIVAGLAERWGLPADFRAWLTDECVWLHTLVDRIVTALPAGHPLGESDPLAVAAEPFALWVVEAHPRAHFPIEHPAVVRPADVSPYFLRKVRILNAAHTALVIAARPRGFRLVREAVEDGELAAFLRNLLFGEIVPTLDGRVDDPAGFAEAVLERFRNPFLDHLLSDIAQHHDAKVKVRLVPTRDEYAAKFGRPPPLLTEVLARDAERGS